MESKPSDEASQMMAEYILTTKRDGVMLLTMNRPQQLNGWTFGMMEALKAAFTKAAIDAETKVMILTGSGRYYSAGVNLAGTLTWRHPKKLHKMIEDYNRKLFELFLDFPKPILIAANGPAIGASVTSATLCDGIIASTQATFSTPFAALGVTPEGCSSILFARLMGEHNAQRMLGAEGWKPSGSEAHEIGLAQWVTSPERLLEEAHEIAKEWIAQGAKRRFRGESTHEELKEVNARESIGIADSFLGAAFLRGQARFLWSKKKRLPAMMFYALWLSHPLWSRLRK